MPGGSILFEAHCPSKDPALDGFTNGFVFTTTGDFGSADFTTIANKVIAFYNSTATGAVSPVSAYMPFSNDNASGHAIINVYDITANLNGSPHGAPVAMISWTLTAPSGSPGSGFAPEGTAMVLSFRAAYGTDVEFAPGARPRARDRGRIYIPANRLGLGIDGTTSRTLITTATQTDLLHAGKALAAPISLVTGTAQWSVWSRKGAVTKPLFELWMDDRPDYQRRRADPTPATRNYLLV